MSIRHYLNVFGDTVPWYGICVSVAVVLMGVNLYWSLRKRPSSSSDETAFLMSFPLLCVFGVCTAIGLDAVFTGDWRTWTDGGVRRFGLTYTGFLVGVILFLAIYGRLTRLGGRYLLNTFLPPLALAQAVGRVGCFLGGCCYGVPCAWGVAYPPGSLPYTKVGDAPLLPIQLIEALLLGLLALVLLRTAFRWRMYVYVLGASIIRFSVEFFRFDYRGTLFGVSVMSPQQLLSLILAVVFLVTFCLDHSRRHHPAH